VNFKKSLLLLVMAVLPVIGYTMKAPSNTVYDPTPLSTIYPIQDNSAMALVALAAMYAPMENEADWIQMVCIGMTEGGCAYFTDNQASELWQSQSGNIGSSSGGTLGDVKEIDEDTQVWKAKLTVFTRGTETSSDVYMLVRREADGNWYLDRMLSAPGISIQ
jgi:hypothetical protein